MANLTQEQLETLEQCARDEACRARLMRLVEAQEAHLYQSVVENQTELIARYRPDLTLTFVNEAYCQFVGFPATELIGHSFLKVVDERWRERVRQDIEAYVLNPRIIFNEHISPRYDGAPRWLQWVRQPIFGEAGELVEIQAVGRDLTNLPYGTAALGDSETRYRRLIENSPDGILITSQTVIRYVNHALVDMLDAHDTGNLLGKTLFDIVHPDFHEIMEARIVEHGHDSEVVKERHKQFVRLDGSVVDVEMTITPIELDGAPASLVFVRDITPRKQSEAMLQDFQEQLKVLHSLSIQLSKADSFDEFCRQAVDEGRAQLGFDRLGLWFLSDDHTQVIGGYGTDSSGATVDERNTINPIHPELREFLFKGEPTISFQEGIKLLDKNNEPVGEGWNAIAPLWSGDEVTGYLSADDLLSQKPASPQQLELLMLYGSTLGHLATRKRAEDALRTYQGNLKALHQLGIDLSKASSFDEFCRQAVEEGRVQLGFDRLALWFLTDDRTHVRGVYGTDKSGQTTDERRIVYPVDDRFGKSQFAEGQQISFWENTDLVDKDRNVLGQGWNAIAPLWSGDAVIGYLSADNLLRQKPASPLQLELLMLYGSTLGHLATRKRAEDELRTYQDNLKALHRLGIDLSKAESLDEFCRLAVEEGRNRLGFGRLGLWLLSEDRNFTIGSYGTDENGETIDERGTRYPVDDRFIGRSFPPGESLALQENVDLKDGHGNVLGKGWHALVALWNGDEVIGFLAADGLLNPEPLSPQQTELLTLYGSTLGHLATRIRAQEALLRQQNAEILFQEQLKQLNEISIELAQSTSFDDLCRQAIEIGCKRLGFDRMSLWFIREEDPRYLRGSYGIDENGQIRAEWEAQHFIPDLVGSPTHHVLNNSTSTEVDENYELRNDRHEVIGHGWLAVTGLRDGQQVIGCLYADNYFKRQPFDNYQVELLTLYGATLGHLAKRRWIEDNLRRSEERYRAIFEGASIGICLTNRQGYPVSPNRAYLDMLGYTADELRQMTFSEFTHPDDRDGNERVFQQLMAGEHAHYQIEKRYICKNGKSIWVRLDASMFPGSDPDDPLSIALIQDISEQKRAVLELRSSEERFRAIFEGSRISISVINEHGYTLSCNPAYERMLGFTADQLRHIPFQEFTHPDDLKENLAAIHGLLDGSLKHRQFEKRYIRKDGPIVWARMNLSLFSETGQGEKLILVMAEDISNIKEAENRLRESEARNRALLAAIPDLIFVQDRDGVLLDYHASSPEKLFAPPEKFMYKPLVDVFPTEAVDLIQPAFDAALVTGDMQVVEYPLSMEGQTRHFECRMIAYSEDRVLSIVRDITGRKQMEQQNLELAVQRERIKIIADFIHDASHEFRTPLSVINSQVYLAMHLDDDAARREQLAGIREQSEVILRLVESLVTMSRLDTDMSAKYMPVSIGDILRALYTHFQQRAAKSEITLRLEQEDDLPWVPGDSDDLYRAFYNVVDNAMRYTSPGGTITIQSQRVSDDRFEVQIADTGSGIEDADLPHIFERFFRGDRAHSTPGFGLGLPVTRRIIERHDGQIEVASQPGEGSTFTISLPLRQPQAEANQPVQT